MMKTCFSGRFAVVAVNVTVLAMTAPGAAQPCPVDVPPEAWQEGYWWPPQGASLPFGGVAEHMLLLKNGKVLCLFQQAALNEVVLFDPDTDAVSNPFKGFPSHFLVCSGHAALPDGRIFFTGGHSGSNRPLATIFDPDALASVGNPGGSNGACTGCWEAQDNSEAMRFYPTCTAMPDGTVLVTDGEFFLADIPMIFDPTVPPGGQPPSLQWRRLNEAQYCPTGCPYNFGASTYPFMFLLSSGRVLMAGSDNGGLIESGPKSPTRKLDTCLEAWSPPVQPDAIRGGSAVMYGPDKIMKAGGRPILSAGDKVYTIDMSPEPPATPEWTERLSLGYPRQRFFLIVLPDGQVLAVGGEDGNAGVLVPELYDPNANPEQPWTDMAAMTIPRMYHSSALLLPDGRVLVAGGNDSPSPPDAARLNGNVFWPPYLFEDDGNGGSVCAARPVIDCVEQKCVDPQQEPVIQYGQAFMLKSAQAAGMDPADPNDKVTLIRLGQATHGWDFEQRFMELAFTLGPESNELSVTPPATPYEAPPGYYMLVIVIDGVPSISAFIKLDPLAPQTCRSVHRPEVAAQSCPPPGQDCLNDPTKCVCATAQACVDGVCVCQSDSNCNKDPGGLSRCIDGVCTMPNNRYLSFTPRNCDQQTAIRITLTASPDFPGAVGWQWWVGQPQEVCENAGQIAPPSCGPPYVSFMAARPQCDPYFADWPSVLGSFGAVHVYGPEIVPNATYDIQVIHFDCPMAENNFSPSWTVPTSLWGDVVDLVKEGVWTPPKQQQGPDPSPQTTEPNQPDSSTC